MLKHLHKGRILAGLIWCTVIAVTVAACGGGDEATPTVAAQATAQPTAMAQATAMATAMAQPTARPAATSAPQATATSAPVQQGVLRIAFPDLQDQGLHPDSPGRRRYIDPLFDFMIGSDLKGELDPARSIVTAWTANSDSTVWTLKIRSGAAFHNGDPVTAKDIKGSFDYTSREGSIHTQTGRVKAAIAEIQVPDDNTAVVRLNETDIWFPLTMLSNLDSLSVSYIMPTAYLQETTDAEYARKPVGSGPYTLKENVIGDRLIYQAVAKHWYYGVPTFATMEFRPIPEASSRIALLKTGAADVAEIGTSDVKGVKEAGLSVIPKDGAGTAIIWPHQQWQEGNPLGNQKVRQALSVAIDRQVIVDAFLAGQGVPSINYPLNVKDRAFVRFPVPQQDIALAKRLLAESGFAPLSLDMVIFSRGLLEGAEIMEAVAVMWEQAGVKVNRIPTDYATARTKWNTQAYPNPTVSGILSVSTRPIGTTLFGSNRPGSTSRLTEDPEIQAAGDRVTQASTVEDYTAGALAMMELVAEKVIYIPLAETSVVFAVRPQVVKAWFPGFGPLTYNVLDIIDPRHK